MSTHVLLNLLNELRKIDKMQGYHFFTTSLIITIINLKEHVYNMSLNVLQNHIVGVKTLSLCHLLRSVIMDVITL